MIELNKNTIGMIAGGVALLTGACYLLAKTLEKKNLVFSIKDRELMDEKGVKISVKILNTGKKDIKNLVYHTVIKDTVSQKFSVGPVKAGQIYSSTIFVEMSDAVDFDDEVEFIVDKMS